MGSYKQYIEDLKARLVGRKVIYPASIDGKVYTIVDIDYNGGVLINLPDEFKDTTAIDSNYWVVDKKDEDTDPFRAFRPQKPHPAIACHDVPYDYLNEW